MDFLSELKTGTTIMAVEFDGGVVIGADSRTTTGSYIANRVTDKLHCVAENIYCCVSGSSADTQAICDVTSYHLMVHKMEFGRVPLVKAAAKIFQDLCYNYREQMSAGIICAGWDHKFGGQVYCIPMGGMCIRQPYSLGGSGSTYIYGFVDANYKDKMTQQECYDFVKEGITLAINRDGSSGGVVRIAVINKDGVARDTILPDKQPKFNEL